MKLKSNPHRKWNTTQVRHFVDMAQESIGGVLGWSYLSHDMRDAVIANKVLTIIIANDADSISTQAIECLYMDMREVAGLNEEQA